MVHHHHTHHPHKKPAKRPHPPPPPPPPKAAPPRRLSNVKLSPAGTFTYSWFDLNNSEHAERMQLDGLLGFLSGRVTASQGGFFQNRLVRNVSIDPTRPWMMQYEAQAGLGSAGWRAYEFDLSQVLYLGNAGQIEKKTPAMLKQTISPTSTYLLPVGTAINTSQPAPSGGGGAPPSKPTAGKGNPAPPPISMSDFGKGLGELMGGLLGSLNAGGKGQ